MRQIIIVISCLLSMSVVAQQDVLLTQFAINKQSYNPSYATVDDYLSFTAIIRDQWNGIDGAPTSQFLSVGLPILKHNIGLGFNLSNEQIGIQKRITFQSNYAYKLKLDQNLLHLGINLSYRNLINDFTDPRLLAIDGFEIDPAIDRVKESYNLLNFGIGAYFEILEYFVGFSVPRLIKNTIGLENNLEGFSKEAWHAYFMAGRNIDVSEKFSFTAEFLFKITENAPTDLDLQLRGRFNEFFILGTNYRTGGGVGFFGESIGIISGFQISEALNFGISYDIPISKFRSNQSGSLELFARYEIGKNNQLKEIVNPRYF